MTSLILKDCDKEAAERWYYELAKVRHWITGFEAAGKHGPAGADALRQIQNALQCSVEKRVKGK